MRMCRKPSFIMSNTDGFPPPVKVSVSELERFVAKLFAEAGLGESDAEVVARVIVLQETRGVVTHGLRRISPNLEGLLGGWINPRPDRCVLRDLGAVAVLDGNGGIGMVGCQAAMDLAIAKAAQFGVGVVSIINHNHFLSAAPYCLQAAEKGMIGIVLSNTQASMGYPGAAGRVIGNGPMGFGAPTDRGFPIIYDGSLTTSEGQLRRWMREGLSIPTHFPSVDQAGIPTQDPEEVVCGGTPLPIGMHKGGGLAILVELLTGVLAGGAFMRGIVPPGEDREGYEDGETQTCVAIDAAHFMDPADFRARVGEMVTRLREQSSDSSDSLLLPGERAAESRARIQAEGITISGDVVADLQKWSERLGIASGADQILNSGRGGDELGASAGEVTSQESPSRIGGIKGDF